MEQTSFFGFVPPGATAAAGSAAFSADMRHRYRLHRLICVGSGEGILPGAVRVLFIMLNPSTADADNDDPTIRRAIGFAARFGAPLAAERRVGCVWLDVANVFSFRSTDPMGLQRELDEGRDPTGGTENDLALLEMAKTADLVVCAWGVHGALRARGERVARLLRWAGVRLHTLGLTKDGHPRHPLYLPKDLRPAAWDGETSRLTDLSLAERDPAEAPGREQLVVDDGHDEDELRADVDGEGAGGDETDGGHGEQLHAPFIDATRPIVAGRRGGS